ncbi:hypothetical protein [Streptomyces sp. NPDC050704]|uniref:hypothetical protein n=1 Tax=Streptomyces sp. NPDC050704 TaxID=3157219 RepID=UPI00344786A4
MTAMDNRPIDAGALINALEGHLLIEATRSEGRVEADRFTGQFRWLTDTQRAEVEERYAEEYLALSRLSWQRTARRGRELRAEYEEAYRKLRRRVYAVCLLGITLCTSAAMLVASLGRGG